MKDNYKKLCASASLFLVAGVSAVLLWPETASDVAAAPLPSEPARGSTKQPERFVMQTNDGNRGNLGSGGNLVPAKPAPRHKTIARKYAHLDKTILGEEPRLDSRASRRVMENRLLGVAADNGLSSRERVALLKSVDTLSAEEQQTLYDAIYTDELPEGVSRAAWNWVVDSMMISLRSKGADPDALTENLTKTFENTSIDLTVRDYAVQHLGHVKGEGGDVAVIQQTLHSALASKEGTLAGTALLAIDNVTHFDDLSGDERTARAQDAYSIASDPSYSIESRVTALQVATRHQPEIVADLAQSILADSEAPQILKLSAQAALNKNK